MLFWAVAQTTDSVFNPEYGDSMLFWIVSICLEVHVAPQPRTSPFFVRSQIGSFNDISECKQVNCWFISKSLSSTCISDADKSRY